MLIVCRYISTTQQVPLDAAITEIHRIFVNQPTYVVLAIIAASGIATSIFFIGFNFVNRKKKMVGREKKLTASLPLHMHTGKNVQSQHQHDDCWRLHTLLHSDIGAGIQRRGSYRAALLRASRIADSRILGSIWWASVKDMARIQNIYQCAGTPTYLLRSLYHPFPKFLHIAR